MSRLVLYNTGCSILFRVLFSQFISATWNEYGHVTYIFKENLKGNSMQKKFAEKHNPYWNEIRYAAMRVFGFHVLSIQVYVQGYQCLEY